MNKEMEDLQLVNAQLALRSAKKLNEAHQKERTSMQHAINKAMEARQQLIWQIAFLAIIAIIAAIILLWYIYQDTKKERVYRETWRMPTRKSSALCDRGKDSSLPSPTTSRHLLPPSPVLSI